MALRGSSRGHRTVRTTLAAAVLLTAGTLAGCGGDGSVTLPTQRPSGLSAGDITPTGDATPGGGVTPTRAETETSPPEGPTQTSDGGLLPTGDPTAEALPTRTTGRPTASVPTTIPTSVLPTTTVTATTTTTATATVTKSVAPTATRTSVVTVTQKPSVTATPSPSTTPSTAVTTPASVPSSSEDGGQSWWIWLLAGLALAAGATALVLMQRRRRAQEEWLRHVEAAQAEIAWASSDLLPGLQADVLPSERAALWRIARPRVEALEVRLDDLGRDPAAGQELAPLVAAVAGALRRVRLAIDQAALPGADRDAARTAIFSAHLDLEEASATLRSALRAATSPQPPTAGQPG